MSPMSTRRVGVASGLVVALAATSLTFFAVTSKGETVHEADLNDGGVWVSSAKDARFARVNKAVGQFDAGVVASSGPGEPVDILQDDNAVAGLVVGSGCVHADRAQVRPARRVGAGSPSPPRGSATNLQVFVPRHRRPARRHRRHASTAKTGKVWAQTYDAEGRHLGLARAGLTAGAKPLATVGAVAAIAVDVKGSVHAVSGATGKVVSIPRTATGSASRSPSRSSGQGRQGRRHHRGRAPAGWSTAPATTSSTPRAATRPSTRGTTRERGPAGVCRAAAARPGRRLRGPPGLRPTLRLLGHRAAALRRSASRSPSATTRRPPLPSRPLRTGALHPRRLGQRRSTTTTARTAAAPSSRAPAVTDRAQDQGGRARRRLAAHQPRAGRAQRPRRR